MIMKNNMKQVVITGGAGFIGSNLVKKLLDEGILTQQEFNSEKKKLLN